MNKLKIKDVKNNAIKLSYSDGIFLTLKIVHKYHIDDICEYLCNSLIISLINISRLLYSCNIGYL